METSRRWNCFVVQFVPFQRKVIFILLNNVFFFGGVLYCRVECQYRWNHTKSHRKFFVNILIFGYCGFCTVQTWKEARKNNWIEFLNIFNWFVLESNRLIRNWEFSFLYTKQNAKNKSKNSFYIQLRLHFGELRFFYSRKQLKIENKTKQKKNETIEWINWFEQQLKPAITR